ncbi:cytochrome P450 [Gymnopilus junonius]|uniref:Cytochrome P450 n=1 Tax=Gymnopilus junonius TaxID=109634 RepID=A0A9P5TRH9_GYMJU|nr:cytochrome P450 [Gymnopilus junonius]
MPRCTLTFQLVYGNLSDIPTIKPWVTYAEWGKTYGDIMHLRIFGQHTVILNSIGVVRDLIERRSHIYSDRPDVPMVNCKMEWDFNGGLMPYGPLWKVHRRLFDRAFKPSASVNYRPIQTRKINDLLHGLLTSPMALKDHYRTVAAAIIMSTVYGYDITPKGDYFVSLAEDAVSKLSESIFPGANVVNAIPFLRFLPVWFPGAGFKRFANETKKLTRQMRDVPFEFVKKGMVDGTASECIVTELLTKFDKPLSDEDVRVIKEVAATSYAAGADTTVSAIGTFFYAMTMFPEVQIKARQEIDAIIGSDRLVTYEDQVSLPYIEAIYREVMRWRPALPLGVARCTLEEDIYNGYYIPKGATVLMNLWAMSHDPRKYKDPELFNPDRYIDSNGNLLPDDDMYAYGFGRRICSGKYMASSTVWLVIASVLSTFKIERKKDKFGKDIPLDDQYTDTLVRSIHLSF